MEEIKRQIARKISIDDLQKGVYIKQEGWQSNFVQTRSGDKVSRINLVGTVVSQQDAQCSIDDGTGRIDIRTFDQSQSLPKLTIGQVIMVIGRPREFDSEMYILPEIVKPIIDKKWIEVRLKELRRNEKIMVEATPQPKKEVGMQEVCEAIKYLDQGNGASTEDVLQKLNAPQTEEIIKKLLREGELFEIAPGKLKIS